MLVHSDMKFNRNTVFPFAVHSAVEAMSIAVKVWILHGVGLYTVVCVCYP